METLGITGLYSDYNALYISGGEVQAPEAGTWSTQVLLGLCGFEGQGLFAGCSCKELIAFRSHYQVNFESGV